MTHTGIRLRVISEAGTLADLDSDRLHMIARLGAVPGEWYKWFPGEGTGLAGGIRLEVQPAELADEYPDDEPDDYGQEPGTCPCFCSNCSGCTG